MELSCFFNDPTDVSHLVSGSFTFAKTNLNIWKFTGPVLLKPGLENFVHYFASMWDECNCMVVWAFLGIAFLWDWIETWPFLVLCQLLSFPKLLVYWVQHFLFFILYFFFRDLISFIFIFCILFIYLIFNFILFNFTILNWFCHISKWICHRYTCVSHPEPSSLPIP